MRGRVCGHHHTTRRVALEPVFVRASAGAVAIDGVRYVVFGCGNCEAWVRAGAAGGELRGEADEKERQMRAALGSPGLREI